MSPCVAKLRRLGRLCQECVALESLMVCTYPPVDKNLNVFTYKSCDLSQPEAKPGPSSGGWLWPGKELRKPKPPCTPEYKLTQKNPKPPQASQAGTAHDTILDVPELGIVFRAPTQVLTRTSPPQFFHAFPMNDVKDSSYNDILAGDKCVVAPRVPDLGKVVFFAVRSFFFF